MATVYLAKVLGEGGFERLVALKVMHPHIANEPDFVSMFLDEARLAARIRHPNVVSTLAVERNEEGLCLVMEYIEGHALNAILRTALTAKKSLSIPVVLRILVDLLEGLHAAHELDGDDGHSLELVHRDVSPQNVLVGADGVSRITDFGVAQAKARLTTTQGSGLKGKVAYVSPEQVMLTGKIDRRADVFAAGIVLWEALTGRRLFRGESEGQTIAQIMAGVQRTPRDVRADVPPAISEVCMKALSNGREDRYQTAVEFADAIEAAAMEAGVTLAKPREVATEILTFDIAAPAIDAGMLRADPTRGGSSSGVSRDRATDAESALVASTAAVPRARAGRWFLIAGLAAVGIGGLAFAVGTRSRGGAPVAAVPPSPVITSSTAHAESMLSAAPEDPVPGPIPSVNAAPAPSAPPSAAVAASAPAKAVTKEPATTPRPTRPTAPGYRPEGL